MKRYRPPSTVAIGIGIAAICGCAHRISSADRRAIEQTLRTQDAAWNAGNIDEFMAPYWHSPDLTFSSGGEVTRGWQPTRDRYKKKYPDKATMGHLDFADLQIFEVTPNVAVVLGRWKLTRAEPIGGAFSLVMRRDKRQWTIVHDHTSTDTKPANANQPPPSH